MIKPMEQLPSNFQNVNQFLHQNDFVKKPDSSQFRSHPSRADTASQNIVFGGKTYHQVHGTINSDDSLRFKDQDSLSIPNRYEDEVQTLLHKI